MGYTHYWEKVGPWDATRHEAALQDMWTIISRTEDPRLAQDYDTPETPPAFDDDGIWFNGVGDEGCETFVFPRIIDPKYGLGGYEYVGAGGRLVIEYTDFTFCKTRQLPYDKVVTACLLAAKHHLGDAIRVASDGDWEEWAEGARLYEYIFPGRKAWCPFEDAIPA